MHADPIVILPRDEYEYHELCTLLDEMDEDEFRQRLENISASPELLQENTVTLTPMGKDEFAILDGRHTYRIAKELGFPVPCKVFRGDRAALVRFVDERNVKRRHWTPAQIAANKLKLLQYAGVEPTRNDILDAGVSESTAKRTLKVAAEGPQELVDAIANGDVKVSTALHAIENEVPEEDILKALDSDNPQGELRSAILHKNPDYYEDSRKGKPKKEKPKASDKPKEPKVRPCASVLDITINHPTVRTATDGHETVLDAYGVVVPDKTGDKFNDGRIKDIIQELDMMKTSLESTQRLYQSYCGNSDFQWTPLAEVRTNLDDLCARLEETIALFAKSLPYVVCPTCKGQAEVNGKFCGDCRGMGYWPIAVASEGDNYRKIIKPRGK